MDSKNSSEKLIYILKKRLALFFLFCWKWPDQLIKPGACPIVSVSLFNDFPLRKNWMRSLAPARA
jgi:hypothetical protein